MADCMFARYQLEKHGWTEGAGLGKHENGIIDPIKVARKSNKDGVGHIPGSDLTTNWWDQAFNKAASKILVKTTTDGVTVHTTETKEDNTKKSLLYSRFVKGATLKPTKGISVEEPEDSSESETEKEKIPSRLTDEEIFKICGGRTAHKAAGHGLKQNGKLQRIWEQEQQYLKSLNKEAEPVSNVPVSELKKGKKRKREAEEQTEEQDLLNEERNSLEESHRKKRKKESQEEAMQAEDSTELVEYTKKEKKKKKKSKERKENKREEEEVEENGKFKSTKKKRKKKYEMEDEDKMEDVDIETVSHKEKKKMKKRRLEEAGKESEGEIGENKKQEVYGETEQEFVELPKKKKKSKVKNELLEETKSMEKKKRKTQQKMEEIEYTEENTNKTLDPSEVEGKEERKKRHKKKKKKEHRKKQETEKSFIKDEESSVNVRQQNAEEDKMEEEIDENECRPKSVKGDNSQKKVRFSSELVAVFTFNDEETDTSPQTP